MSNETQPAGKLARKLATIAGAIEAVEKDGKNKDQNYRYATPASVMSAIKPHLAKHGVMIVPHLVDFVETDTGMKSGGGKPFVLNRVLMHYHILDGESGEAMVVPWQGQAGTYGDDKGLAKAQTIALRTFLIQLFQIPAEDPDHDPDAADARPVQGASYQPAQQQRAATNGQANGAERTVGGASSKQIGLIRGLMKKNNWAEADTLEWAGLQVANLDALNSRQASELIEALQKAAAETTEQPI